jgi:galactofuranose transport system ATP-binding protein
MAAQDGTGEPVLRLTGIDKSFPGVRALLGVNLSLRAGEIHALMGQNGAGKSTLIKVLTGVYPQDAGEMRLNGVPIRPATPLQAQALGLSTVYQEVNLCPNLSVAENIFAGRYPRRGPAGLWRIDWARMHRDARAVLARLHLDIDVTRLLSSYSVAVQQLVGIARALSLKSQVLILDEPTSSLDEQEVQTLHAVLRRLRDEGLAILFVTHFLDEVYAIADRITVLRDGALVGEYRTTELNSAALVRAMIGRELAAQAERRDAAPVRVGASVLQARAIAQRGQLQPVDIELFAGEVLGLAGLLGSGRTELARLLFGMQRADSGELLAHGKPVTMDTPARAIRLGLAMCPEDRKAEGIVADLSLRENIVLALQSRFGVWRSLTRSRQDEIAMRFIKALSIRATDADMKMGLLSGGNQQKALLARWLATDPALLILDEPTRGIDVGAKQEIMGEIVALARQGKSVLFISAELDEVARISDRIAVMRERRKCGELPGGSDEKAILELIAGPAA